MEESFSLSSRVQAVENVNFREVHGEVVLLNLKTGFYYGLNSLGARIWQLIQENQSLGTILSLLLEEYEVPKEQCSRDLFSLVSLMRQKGLVEVLNEEAA